MLEKLDLLIEAYAAAPEIYQAGRYWKAYEDKIYREIRNADLNQLRSGKYPIFGTFGFSEAVHHYPPHIPGWKTSILKLLRSFSMGEKIYLPYGMTLQDVREMAYHHCQVQGRLSGAIPIESIETSSFGAPSDLFSIDGKNYTLQFLSYYLRYCFVQQNRKFKGDEVIVELGSGSGFQLEVLKKMYPELSILCFDLPSPLFLCEFYLGKVFENGLVSSSENIEKQSLDFQKGKINMFGNWQFPLLENQGIDIFWNAASFGEMEPHIVANYLSVIKGNASSIYLLQARQGKESSQTSGVVQKILFEDYKSMLDGYSLKGSDEVYQAHRKLSQSGGYFQGLWSRDSY